jgi:hypothetical protein
MDILIPHEALIRIQMQFVEMPGLKLTPLQIERLCGLPRDICEGALVMLTHTGFLKRAQDGAFRRPVAEVSRSLGRLVG